MISQKPTSVSVELAANDVLPASTGRVSAMTPYANWERDYDAVLDAVQSTGARAVLVGVPNDAAQFPSIRRASKLATDAARSRRSASAWSPIVAQFRTISSYQGYLLTLVAQAPASTTCADVAGARDYVLTPEDVAAI